MCCAKALNASGAEAPDASSFPKIPVQKCSKIHQLAVATCYFIEQDVQTGQTAGKSGPNTANQVFHSKRRELTARKEQEAAERAAEMEVCERRGEVLHHQREKMFLNAS